MSLSVVQNRCRACSRALPPGAQFCPHCGHSLTGKAPAVQQEDWSFTQFIDQVWDFFASTRVAIVLIFLLAVASIFGSLIEQEGLYNDWRPPELYYPFRYGEFWGPLYLRLGLTHAYSSSWFLTLLLMCCVSLIVCSLQRIPPLYRALRSPEVEKPVAVVRRQPVVHELPGASLEEAEEALRKAGYRVRRAGESLHADKGALSRWGPYIIHIGLLLVAAAAFTRAIPGWHVDNFLWVADGETVLVPGTDFAVRSEGFTAEFYPDGRPSLFRTAAVVIDGGKEVVRRDIEVNKPLVYKGFYLFQMTWKEELGVASVALKEDRSGTVIGRTQIDLKNPLPSYQVGGATVHVREYYHDFGLDEQGNPVNQSRELVNPVLFLEFAGPKGENLGAQVFSVLHPNLREGVMAPIRLDREDLTVRRYTGLAVRKDLSFPYVMGGLAFVFLGMLVTFFMFHRQVWVRAVDGGVALGARTNKNPFGLKQEMQRIARRLGGAQGVSADA